MKTSQTLPDLEDYPGDIPTAAQRVGDDAWWHQTMSGVNATSELADLTLAECMRYIDMAWVELQNVPLFQLGSTLVVMQALKRLQQSAMDRARLEVARESE